MKKNITVENLTKKIKNKTLVENLNFTINEGEIVGFLGPNGAGKTTTMRLMVGLMSITSGDIYIHGSSIKNDKKNALKKVGGIIENPEMYEFMSGYDNLLHFQRMHGSVNKEEIDYIVHLVGLNSAIKSKVKTYSLGMKQRLGIAQALLHNPLLLVLDEPTNGLDPSGIRQIRDYLRMIAKEKSISIFISSHLLSEIELLCDRIIIIQNGNIIDSVNVSELKDKKNNTRLYLKVEPQDKALDFLSSNGYKVKMDKDRLVLTIPYNSLPDVNNKLIQNKFKIYTIEEERETLEDHFLLKTLKGGVK